MNNQEIPKETVQLTEHGIPVRNLWYMLLYVWNATDLREHWRAEVESAPNLDALLSTILANLIQQRLRIGLGQNYHEYACEIPGVRGRVDFSRSLKRMSFQHGRAACRFEMFSPNVPKNQIVRATLARLAQLGQFGVNQQFARQLRSRLRKLDHTLEGVDPVELNAAMIQREQLKRHDRDYRLMLAICSLLYQRLMPTEISGTVSLLELQRQHMKLSEIFEKFVAKFYQEQLQEWKITSQETIRWPAEEPSKFLPVMKPDLTLRHKPSGKLIVLDTKFTRKSLSSGRWDNLTYNRDHLFQIYAYLRSQEERSESRQQATGVLLYPTVKHELQERVTIQGHPIWWSTVDLAMPWQEIESRLLSFPETCLAEFQSRSSEQASTPS